MKGYIDLHVHSIFSDGSCCPAELVSLANEAGLSAIALTDHDTTEGFAELKKAAEATGLEVVPGVEISAAFNRRDIHILGLLADPEHDELCSSLADARSERDRRNEKMIANLAGAGIKIDLDELKAENPNSVITRAHFAKYMVGHGMVRDYEKAFEYYLNDRSPYYVARKYIEPEDAVKLILRAGGVPVLAHPLLYHLEMPQIDALVTELKGYGLRGIEAIYSKNEGFDEQNMRALAKKHDLLITGGSDFHGKPKPGIRIGVGHGNLKIPYELLTKLREEKDCGSEQ